jgi:EAL domain-containing protein (putative c-di-GMP-specific phosphodiesterase class I)
MVDVAPAELRGDLVELIDALLGAYRLRADALIVRIPSYSCDAPAPVLERLVERGVMVAVREPDLRGVELGLLAGAPIDVIELPAALVDHCDRDRGALDRLGRRIEIAHSHDWLTLARGLDRLTQVDALVRLGCELASGPAVGPLLERAGADRVVARYFPGAIARPGQWIACLPNRVFLDVQGQARRSADAISF